MEHQVDANKMLVRMKNLASDLSFNLEVSRQMVEDSDARYEALQTGYDNLEREKAELQEKYDELLGSQPTDDEASDDDVVEETSAPTKRARAKRTPANEEMKI